MVNLATIGYKIGKILSMCFQNEIFLLQSSRNQEMLKEIPSITIQWITLQDNCIRRGYVYYRGQAETFSRFYVLLQTIYCFRFDYAYLCRVYFSTLLLCICIISLGLKLLSSLFSSTYSTYFNNMHFIFKKECHGVGDVVLFF